MAINVDTVYKTVLLILNKEQRGYMTPPEFNRIGTQVQLDIFDQYFEDLNQQLRVPQSDADYADRQIAIDEKISLFKTEGNCVYSSNKFNLPIVDSDGNTVLNSGVEPSSANQVVFYKLGTLIYSPPSGFPTEIQRLQRNDFYNIEKSPITASTKAFPTYLYESNKIIVRPTTIISDVTTSFIRKPRNIVWAFTPGVGQSYVFNNQPGSGSVNFELSSTEQTNVILKILLYAGIVIRDPQIVQAAAREIQQEETNKKS